jgi:transcriptional regulator GlxA family with amidase domain
MKRAVVVVGFEGVQALDLVGPFDVFTGATVGLAGEGRPDHGYDVTLVSVDGHSVSTGTGLDMVAAPLPDATVPCDTIVLPGGFGTAAARDDEALVEWIRAAAPHARRVVSVCSGAMLAAEAGLLDGCRATTHWAFAAQLAAEYPAVQVDPEPIFVRSSERVWTAAGVTSGIDLTLALVEDDYGTALAQTVARWLVMYLRRPGGQTQFAAPV